jgi:hypothetical protein
VSSLGTTAPLLRDGFTPGASGVAPVDGAAVFFDALDSGLGRSHAFWMGLFDGRVCNLDLGGASWVIVVRNGWVWGGSGPPVRFILCVHALVSSLGGSLRCYMCL